MSFHKAIRKRRRAIPTRFDSWLKHKLGIKPVRKAKLKLERKQTKHERKLLKNTCAFCGQTIKGTRLTKHHLIPRSEGGGPIVYVHQKCHKLIHLLFTNKVLALEYNTIEKIKTDPRVKAAILWVTGMTAEQLDCGSLGRAGLPMDVRYK